MQSTHAVLEARAFNMALWPFHTSVYNTNVMNKDIFSLNSVLTKGGNLILAELDNALEGNSSVLLTSICPNLQVPKMIHLIIAYYDTFLHGETT